MTNHPNRQRVAATFDVYQQDTGDVRALIAGKDGIAYSLVSRHKTLEAAKRKVRAMASDHIGGGAFEIRHDGGAINGADAFF